MKKTYCQWLEACLNMGIPAITIDTAARLMAILYEYGNNEGFTFSQKFIADKDYIQKRFGLHGAGIVDPDFLTLLKKYIKELQDYYNQHTDGAGMFEIRLIDCVPEWAPRLLEERYQIDFIG